MTSPSSPTSDRIARRATLAALAAAALIVPVLLAANMANPVKPGDRVGEPSAALAGIVVEREALNIDLRPLARGEKAAVEATYRLRNDGAARDVELVFVADALAGGAAVWVDGRPVPVSAAAPADTALPPSWRAPRATPRLDDGGDLAYEAGGTPGEDGVRRAGTLLFRVPLPTGRHVVRVRYRAAATAHSRGSPAVNWQLGYVLAPARRWAGFGGLDARVLLPTGWRAAARPEMAHGGDTLAARWDSVPADALALTARAPEPKTLGLKLLLLALAGLGLVGCIRAGVRSGGGLALRRRHLAWAALPALGLALAWATLVVAGGLWIPGWVAGRMGNQLATGYGYGAPILGILAWPILFLLAVSVFMIAALRSHRRTRRAMRDPLAPRF